VTSHAVVVVVVVKKAAARRISLGGESIVNN
jgi:hypothetical protein